MIACFACLLSWGQFLDHELDLTEPPEHDRDKERLSVMTPTVQDEQSFDTGETFHRHIIPFTRSRFTVDRSGVAQQTNQITSYIDASNVYGSDDDRSFALRTADGTGMLRTSQAANGEDLCPLNDGPRPVEPNAHPPGTDPAAFFLAGDIRANENLLLIGMHALFVREHNFWCRYSAAAYPHWVGNDERIYQHARRMVTGIMQSITFNEFLPALLGEDALGPYRGYDPSIDASVSTEFATAGYRFGHSMVGSHLRTSKEEEGADGSSSSIPLRDAFFKPDHVQQHGVDDLLLGACYDPMHEVDGFVVEDLRSFLFGAPGVPDAGMMHDLPALNIQRGRDHGLPGYCTMRASFGLPVPPTFDDIPTTPERRRALARLYDRPDDIDPWVGALVETHAPGAAVGPLIQAILVEQFERSRAGDRFWYENDAALSPQEKAALRGTTLSDVLRRNVSSGGEGFPDDVFRTVPAAATPPPAVEPANWQIFEFHDTDGHLIRIAGVVPYTPQNGLRLIVPSHGVDTALVGFDGRSGRYFGAGGGRGTMPRPLIPFFTSGFLQARLFEFTDARGNMVRILGPGRHEDGRPRQMPVIMRWPLDGGANTGSLGIWSGFDSVTGQYQVRNHVRFEVPGTAPEGTVPQGRREELRAFERSGP